MDPSRSRLRIGVDLGGTKIEAIALDPGGGVLARTRVATPRGDYAATVEAVAGLVEAIERDLGATGSVGIGIPGSISPRTGRIRNANSTWLIGEAFDADVAARLGRPIRIQNDANCFAVSEAVDGAGAGAATVFGVILGTGVGGGFVVDGRPLPGANLIAGEWGHNALPWPRDDERPGPDCYCGRRGCVETFLSGPGLVADFRRHGGPERAAAEIAAAAARNDPDAKAAMARYHERLARALAMVVNIVDPEVIVLGGGLSNVESLYSAVPALWGEWVFADHVGTALRRADHGDSSGVRGAAWLW